MNPKRCGFGCCEKRAVFRPRKHLIIVWFVAVYFICLVTCLICFWYIVAQRCDIINVYIYMCWGSLDGPVTHWQIPVLQWGIALVRHQSVKRSLQRRCCQQEWSGIAWFLLGMGSFLMYLRLQFEMLSLGNLRSFNIKTWGEPFFEVDGFVVFFPNGEGDEQKNPP